MLTSFMPLAFILNFFDTTIEINGQPNPRPWGHSYFDLPAGDYQVKVHFNYLFGPAGASPYVVVRVHPGHESVLRYEAPLVVFSAGTLRQIQ